MLKIDNNINDICHGILRYNIRREGIAIPSIDPKLPAVDHRPINPPSSYKV